ncbi:MAG: (deoxy)nucleoside triphosphate pyrophosphohydrolase [Alphaproteobacteria bacterium]|nr:(deoxy)nucleoside triphosphate pyrophosphohydrolase [Alphaproteobacteria bacterium]
MKQVSAGIIIYHGKILIARRNHHKSLSGMWEFPGGKQEVGETLPECLKREIMEELQLEITVGDFFMQSVYEYEHGAICLNAYYAYADSDKICFHSDHDSLKWITPDELDDYDFSPADIPIKNALKILPLPI